MIEVEALKSKAEIEATKMLLKKHHGELFSDVFGLGINLAFRISDLLSIRFDMIDMDKRTMSLVEGKTGKTKTVKFNNNAIAIVNKRRDANPNDEYLFQSKSNRVKNAEAKPVTRQAVGRAFKDVGDMLGVQLSTHSMRKTLGYIMYSEGKSIEIIAKMLNHSSTGVTLRYIGITRQEVLDLHDEFEL